MEAFSLVEAGYSVRVICRTDATETRMFENIAGVATYRYPQPPEWGGLMGYVIEYGYSLAMTFVISLYIALRHGFDAIHAHTPPDMFVAIASFYKWFGVRYVMDHHDLSPEMYAALSRGGGHKMVCLALQFFERWSCRCADQLIATNETQRTIEIERCGVSPERTNVVRNGPDLNRFVERVAPIDDLCKPNRYNIGYMGRIGFQDSVDHLIRALDHLKCTLGRSDFQGVIIGDGPALPSLKKLVAELSLQDDVTFVGYQTGDHLQALLASCDILTTPDSPSPYNQTCTMIKTMEYMAMSRPVVGYDMPEHRYSAGSASLYARAGDTYHYATCLATLMDDPQLRLTMGRAGRERIETTLAWQHQRGHLLHAYAKLFGTAADETRESAGPGRSLASVDREVTST